MTLEGNEGQRVRESQLTTQGTASKLEIAKANVPCERKNHGHNSGRRGQHRFHHNRQLTAPNTNKQSKSPGDKVAPRISHLILL